MILKADSRPQKPQADIYKEIKMKITKRQLKRIIKEERLKLVKEQRMGLEDNTNLYANLSDEQLDALDALEDVLRRCMDSGLQAADIMDTVKSLIDPGMMV